jgi:hypothetical protein
VVITGNTPLHFTGSEVKSQCRNYLTWENFFLLSFPQPVIENACIIHSCKSCPLPFAFLPTQCS